MSVIAFDSHTYALNSMNMKVSIHSYSSISRSISLDTQTELTKWGNQNLMADKMLTIVKKVKY